MELYNFFLYIYLVPKVLNRAQGSCLTYQAYEEVSLKKE